MDIAPVIDVGYEEGGNHTQPFHLGKLVFSQKLAVDKHGAEGTEGKPFFFCLPAGGEVLGGSGVPVAVGQKL